MVHGGAEGGLFCAMPDGLGVERAAEARQELAEAEIQLLSTDQLCQ